MAQFFYERKVSKARPTSRRSNRNIVRHRHRAVAGTWACKGACPHDLTAEPTDRHVARDRSGQRRARQQERSTPTSTHRPTMMETMRGASVADLIKVGR